MPVTAIIGAQWGDEGKGKLVDALSEKVDIVCRYQGGANAGHTVHIKNQKYVLHLIPGGIFRPNVVCVIGNGVVFDPEAFFEEINILEEQKIGVDDRLFVSDRAHVIFPYHKLLDQLAEQHRGKHKIGTTGRGIGPAYVDKFNRSGIRVIDLFDESRLKIILEDNVHRINKLLVEEYQQLPISLEKVNADISALRGKLAKYVTDTVSFLHKAWRMEKSILLEGAQGSLLDVDFGSYPYVTSSNPSIGGAVTGTGLPPQAIDQTIGVIKGYMTRVGEGPFPTEQDSQVGDSLRRHGNEYGATTGRPRRCGWLDLVAAKHVIKVNGITSLAVTKLDVLSKFDEIHICTEYIYEDSHLEEFPAASQILNAVEPVWKTFSGWKKDISACLHYTELPAAAKNYISFIEKSCSTPASYVSVGVERDQLIRK
jgi:adenylosuccinate synthase